MVHNNKWAYATRGKSAGKGGIRYVKRTNGWRNSYGIYQMGKVSVRGSANLGRRSCFKSKAKCRSLVTHVVINVVG